MEGAGLWVTEVVPHAAAGRVAGPVLLLVALLLALLCQGSLLREV